jgi:hypothetical protein
MIPSEKRIDCDIYKTREIVAIIVQCSIQFLRDDQRDSYQVKSIKF